jgi:type II secretory pathway pseudopilin PulG
MSISFTCFVDGEEVNVAYNNNITFTVQIKDKKSNKNKYQLQQLQQQQQQQLQQQQLQQQQQQQYFENTTNTQNTSNYSNNNTNSNNSYYSSASSEEEKMNMLRLAKKCFSPEHQQPVYGGFGGGYSSSSMSMGSGARGAFCSGQASSSSFVP